MKRCPKCQMTKPLDEFSLHRRNKIDGRQANCKTCHASFCRERYGNNKSRHRALDAKRQDELRRLLWAYLEEHPCTSCPEKDPRVLDFDHVRGVKIFNISDGVSQRMGWARILEEIEKCQVLCVRCHRIKTHIERGYWSPPTSGS